MQFVSLKNDYVFRELFSYENVRKQFLSDVLGIPAESMKSVRIVNPYLWKRLRRQKQGILDMALELDDGTKINIELQVRRQNHWIERKLFYLAKMYTEDLKSGQDYGKLRRCISISILDFKLTEEEECHSAYLLRNKSGRELTGLFELHIIELGKKLNGTDPVTDWVRLFNAQSWEDLDMIRTKNRGIMEAMEILRKLSLSRPLRLLYEQRLKDIRDRRAEDEYVWDAGKAEGIAQSIFQLLEEYGNIPLELKEKIMSEKNIEVLYLWLKTASKSQSIAQFREDCGL